MTRFEKEWSGALGEFWERNAHEEVRKLLDRKDDIEVDEDGAAKWKTSGNYLPSDVIEKLIYGGADWFSPEATEEKRNAQTAEALENYRRNYRVTEEERAEMRAAFGKDETIVDIITGERISL